MSFTRVVLRSLQYGSLHQLRHPPIARFLSIDANSANGNKNSASFESADEFERRIFGDFGGSNSKTDAFFQKLDRIERARVGSKLNVGVRSEELDGLDDGLDTLEDGMDGKLQESAKYFEFDEIEAEENEDFSFRADVNAAPGSTYEIEDLDLRKPGVWRPTPRDEFEVTTEEVLAKADFRNVRFLANFITEAGIIIKRSKTKISAKAQRKIAREIKTARAFGLMPFTTMGTKSFVFGKTMESRDEDYEYETYGGGRSFVDEDLD